MRTISLLIGMGLTACQVGGNKVDSSVEETPSDTEDTSGDVNQDDSNPISDCPENVDCYNTFPLVLEGDTKEASSDTFDVYNCAPTTDESGPEILYRLTLPTAGFLALELSEMQAGVDIDVHLLSADDPDACIDRGHWRAGGYLDAGDYWAVADTWVDSAGQEKSGAFRLSVGFTTVADFQAVGMDEGFAEDVLYAYGQAWSLGDGEHFTAAFTDFSLHSSDERFWLWDMTDGSSLGNYHVAHGENSSAFGDEAYADTFSNINNSHQSSLGVMRASETYTGAYGYSMRMDGLEPGYNDLVRSRAIVMHPWEGSRPEYVDYYGMVAPTWGCPGIDDRESEEVINALADGGLMVFWYPDGDWIENSSYLP